MFSNIGKKIKTLATVICILGIIASIFISILLFVKADDWSTRRYYDYDRYSRSYRSVVDSSSATEMRIYAGLLLVFGPLVSWLNQFLLYGLGELIDRATSIDNKITGTGLPAAQRPAAPAPSLSAYISASGSQPVQLKKESGWICGQCGKINGDDALFCPECGASRKSQFAPDAEA